MKKGILFSFVFLAISFVGIAYAGGCHPYADASLQPFLSPFEQFILKDCAKLYPKMGPQGLIGQVRKATLFMERNKQKIEEGSYCVNSYNIFCEDESGVCARAILAYPPENMTVQFLFKLIESAFPKDQRVELHQDFKNEQWQTIVSKKIKDLQSDEIKFLGGYVNTSNPKESIYWEQLWLATQNIGSRQISSFGNKPIGDFFDQKALAMQNLDAACTEFVANKGADIAGGTTETLSRLREINSEAARIVETKLDEKRQEKEEPVLQEQGQTAQKNEEQIVQNNHESLNNLPPEKKLNWLTNKKLLIGSAAIGGTVILIVGTYAAYRVITWYKKRAEKKKIG